MSHTDILSLTRQCDREVHMHDVLIYLSGIWYYIMYVFLIPLMFLI